MDVFCERCGTPQPRPEVAAPRSAGVLARRVLDAVGITENQPTPAEDWLRLCLTCRGYSCPSCWNDAAGVCQTCEPMPEPIVEVLPEPMPEPVVIERTTEPIPYWVSQLEPLVAPREPEPVMASEPEPVNVADPEPVFVAEAEQVLIAEAEPVLAVEAEPALVPEPVEVLDPDPVFAAEPEPEPVVAAEPEPEPLVAAEPEPEPEPVIAEPEPEAEPVIAEPEPEPEPTPVERPRMPVLPLPPPRPADAPAIPLPPLPTYPVTPQISFNAQVSVAASSQTSAPAYEAHLLLAPPPPELPAHAIAAGLRPCPNCRLTLSARAHFCRRCGAAQAH